MTSTCSVRITENCRAVPVRIVNLDDLLAYLSANGIIDTEGSHIENPPRWDDLRFPAQGINPVGAAAPPSVDNDPASFPGTLLFAGNQENDIGGIAQLPHAWKEGTDIHPHIHWAKVAADGSSLAVGWQFQYRLSDAGGVFSAWSGWADHTLVLGDNTSAELHNISDLGNIPMTGRKVSCIIAWALRRTGNTDAYNGVARLFELDFHYQVDSLGSAQEYTK